MRRLLAGVALLALIYAVLLIPSPHPQIPPGCPTGMTNFVWNQDDFWRSLESDSLAAQKRNPEELARDATAQFSRIEGILATLQTNTLAPDAPLFRELENSIFRLAATIGAQPGAAEEFAGVLFRVRSAVKEQSWRGCWDMNSFPARSCLYRLLFGARTAVDEVLIQRERSTPLALERVPAAVEPASALLRMLDGTAIEICSGDLLLSRGDAPTSAFIARGNDFPGNFSHVALAHVDDKSREILIIESLIHHGLVVTTAGEYASNKLRLAVLRLRRDHPKLIADAGLPHRAAAALLRRAREERVPYDFTMNWHDPQKLFCSEVAATAYNGQGVNLWMGMSHISSPGLKRWLAGFGVQHFETQEPSDLEYDPQLMLVSEWRGDIQRDRAHNAAIDAMLETAENGAELGFSLWKLPFARAAKAASVVANVFHSSGMIPEGMDASAALRQVSLTDRHKRLESRLRERAERYRAERGYAAPYWEMVRLARESAE